MAQQTSLAAAITTTGQSSITVSDYLGFPTSGDFSILIESEVLRVTAGHSTTTWTVTRGYASTTAATHSNGTTIYHVPDTYADLGDLLGTMDLPTGSARLPALVDLLVDAREQTDADCFRSFLKTPATGTVTIYCDIVNAGESSLVAAIGHPYSVDGRALDFVSITTISYRESEADGSTYTSFGTSGTDWFLEAGPLPGVAGTDVPYEDVTLSESSSTRTTYPTGKRAVKIVCVLGFPSVPLAVKRGTIDKVREAYRQGPGGGPAQIGTNQFGSPVYLTGMPGAYRELTRPGSPYVKRSWRQ